MNKKRILIVLLAILAPIVLLLSSGCNSTPYNVTPGLQLPEKIKDAPFAAVRSPLIERTSHFEYKNDILILPFFIAPSVDNSISTVPVINNSIVEMVKEYTNAHVNTSDLEYTVSYNNNGLLSMFFNFNETIGDTEYQYIETMTFDCDTGERLFINDLFDASNDEWRRVFPDLITESAQSLRMLLLSDIPPISDDQMFYLSEKGKNDELVIVYQQYEITTYSYTLPKFSMPYSSISKYIPETSVLRRMSD